MTAPALTREERQEMRNLLALLGSPRLTIYHDFLYEAENTARVQTESGEDVVDDLGLWNSEELARLVVLVVNALPRLLGSREEEQLQTQKDLLDQLQAKLLMQYKDALERIAKEDVVEVSRLVDCDPLTSCCSHSVTERPGPWAKIARAALGRAAS